MVVQKIASDVPEALDPLEIKHRQELVVPTLPECTLAGLLMLPFCIHHHHRYQASGFFVKLTLNCSRCQRMFTIVTWLGQSLMTRRRCHRTSRAVHAKCRRDGHYQICLLKRWFPTTNHKPCTVHVHVVTGSRKSLKTLYEDYKTFMEDTVAKGYARKLPRIRRVLRRVRRGISTPPMSSTQT